MRPARAAAPGAPRLWALTEHWLTYTQTPLFAGGCFWAAGLPDFDSRPGAVRDALAEHRRTWLTLLTDELRHAVAAEQTAELDPDLVAFQIDAVLMSANTALRLGDVDAASKVRRVVEWLVRAPPASIDMPKD
ncbi:TetR family transcriptional regulator C-terminal domain-containing protein [Streptomyces sp. NPDC057136]|uniref:TetR family transcriptional regulator C-terminal domain-containing protein n=1 Tax=Streptomyces sp. NPDC057136 TaxID=3346029 RepID=UPI0036441D22